MAERITSTRLRFAPKVPVAWIVQLYRRDALQLQDEELVDKVGGRLLARCLDVLMVSDGRLACAECHTEFQVPWIGEPPDRVAQRPGCNWSITAGAFRLVHALHVGGGPAARNLLEGRPKQVLAILDSLASR